MEEGDCSVSYVVWSHLCPDRLALVGNTARISKWAACISNEILSSRGGSLHRACPLEETDFPDHAAPD